MLHETLLKPNLWMISKCSIYREGDDCVAAMAVQVLVGNLSIPLVYGAQGNELNEKFLKFIDEEKGHGLILQMDRNIYAVRALLKNDPNHQHRNVVNDLMLNFIKKLLIAERMEFCLSNLVQIKQNTWLGQDWGQPYYYSLVN